MHRLDGLHRFTKVRVLEIISFPDDWFFSISLQIRINKEQVQTLLKIICLSEN